MQGIIGNRLLKELRPQAKPYEVRDKQLKGFMVRVQPSGSMTYIVQYSRGKRLTLGRVGVLKPADAREEAKQVLGGVMKGLDPVAPSKEDKPRTLSVFLDEDYEPWASVHLKTFDAILARIRAAFADFLDDEIGEIDPHAIERWRTKRLKAGRKASTVNRDLVCLRAALSKAVEWGLVDAHPLAKVRPIKEDSNKSPRYLTKTEAERLLAAMNAREERLRIERDSANRWRAERKVPLLPDLKTVTFADHLKPMVLLSLYTGLRRGELFNLTWRDINFDQGMLTVQGGGAKSGKTRHIPLNDTALDLLKDWRAQSSKRAELVFANKDGQRFDHVNTSWRAVLKDAKIDGFRWHDLRHTFASWLVMASVDLNTVRELLGHSDLKMTLRYAHLAPEHKAAAVGKLRICEI